LTAGVTGATKLVAVVGVEVTAGGTAKLKEGSEGVCSVLVGKTVLQRCVLDAALALY